MTVRRVFSGGPFEAKIGYCRAIEADGWIHVAGSTGTDPETGEMPQDVAEQCRNALNTIRKALVELDADFSHAVRVTYMLPVAADFEACWPVLREAFAAHPPVATMIECGLISPAMKIEIELTAYKG